MSEAKSWSETPMLCSKQRAGHGSSLHSKGREAVGGGGGYQLKEELTSD